MRPIAFVRIRYDTNERKRNKSESFFRNFTAYALKYVRRSSARFLTSMLSENYDDAANFVGARPKLKLTPVSRTASKA